MEVLVINQEVDAATARHRLKATVTVLRGSHRLRGECIA